MARLRREEEARSYERMMNVPPAGVSVYGALIPGSKSSREVRISGRAATDEDDEMTFADINRLVALIITGMRASVACRAALGRAARHWSVGSRLGLSMSGGGLVGVAEVVIYSGYLRRVEQARSEEKKKVETKQIVGTWAIAKGAEEKVEVLKGEDGEKGSLMELRRRKGSSLDERRLNHGDGIAKQ